MLELLLVRPGTTDFDLEERILGTLDVPLSKEADPEIAKMVREFSGQSIDAVYASPSQSSVQTAEHIGNVLSMKSKTLSRLINLNMGLWQGMLVEEVKRKQPKVFKQWLSQPTTICPPEGEMLQTAQQRVEAALAKIFKKHKDGKVIIVAPEPLASLIGSVSRKTQLKDVCQPNGGRWEAIELETPVLTNV
jgi:probable phosphoglycerate mutase